MEIKEFIEKCEESENLSVKIDYKSEYQIKIVNCSENVKEHILSRLLTQDDNENNNIVKGYMMAKINAHYGDIILYKIDDILKVIKEENTYKKMYEKLRAISETRTKEEHRRYAPFYISYHMGSRSETINGIDIKLNAEAYSGPDSRQVRKVVKDNFKTALKNAGISYTLEYDYQNNERDNIIITKEECDTYEKNKKWCKDTRQEENFDKLFGF